VGEPGSFSEFCELLPDLDFERDICHREMIARTGRGSDLHFVMVGSAAFTTDIFVFCSLYPKHGLPTSIRITLTRRIPRLTCANVRNGLAATSPFAGARGVHLAASPN
jgi:hypothetical protein